MAGNARFHDKHHRTNHHTLSTVGIPDSATDPIASHSQPFQGDFVVNGVLSSSRGLDVLSANYGGDVYCENIYVRNTTYTDFISGGGTETIISDGALTGHGANTLTMDFGTAIYSKVNNNTIMYVNSSKVGIGTTSPNERLTIDKNISFVGASAHYIKSEIGSDNGFIVFGGTSTGTNSYLIHPYYSLSSVGNPIWSDYSLDTILPYQERKIVYGSEQITRYFLVGGTPTNPLAVPSDAGIIGIRAFAYSGNNKFNSYGLGGNASIDLRTAGVQSLTNNGGYIIFSTTPMNSGTSTSAVERMRITSEGNVGIGTSNPTEKLYVDGNVLITGNLSALGDLTQIDTSIITTSAVIIDTLGTDNALRITQRGTGNALLVEDEASDSTAFVINSSGDVGIGINTPLNKLHVNGSITIPNGNYLNLAINNGHTAIRRNTGLNGMEFFTSSNSRMFISDDGNVGIGTSTLSSNFHLVGSALITENLSALSGVFSPNINTLTNTANSVFSTVSSNSANWESTYSTVSTNSANWESTYSTVSSNSANWESTYSTVSTNSANWESTYSTVSTNSANWESTYSTVSSNSANWESTYSTVSSNSANWESTYSTVSSNSANWESTYSTVSSNSANWESTYSTVSSNSANWESTYSTVSSNSANWESTYSNVSSNSAQWLSGNSTLSFVASTIHVEKLSAHNLFLSNTLFVSVTSITGAPSTTLALDTSCPSYIFASVSANGTFTINLPAIASNNKGMFFHIKNTSPLNTEIIAIHDSGGVPISFGSTLNGNDNHCTQVVWDGNTWQTIFNF